MAPSLNGLTPESGPGPPEPDAGAKALIAALWTGAVPCLPSGSNVVRRQSRISAGSVFVGMSSDGGAEVP